MRKADKLNYLESVSIRSLLNPPQKIRKRSLDSSLREDPQKRVIRQGLIYLHLLEVEIDLNLLFDKIDPNPVRNISQIILAESHLDLTRLLQHILVLGHRSCESRFLQGDKNGKLSVPIEGIEQPHTQGMITKQPEIVRLLIEDGSIEREELLFSVSYQINPDRCFCLQGISKR